MKAPQILLLTLSVLTWSFGGFPEASARPARPLTVEQRAESYITLAWMRIRHQLNREKNRGSCVELVWPNESGPRVPEETEKSANSSNAPDIFVSINRRPGQPGGNLLNVFSLDISDRRFSKEIFSRVHGYFYEKDSRFMKDFKSQICPEVKIENPAETFEQPLSAPARNGLN